MKFELFKDGDSYRPDWYWHLKAKNGNIIATGAEGYRNRSVMVRTMRRIFAGSPLLAEVEKAYAESKTRG